MTKMMMEAMRLKIPVKSRFKGELLDICRDGGGVGILRSGFGLAFPERFGAFPEVIRFGEPHSKEAVALGKS